MCHGIIVSRNKASYLRWITLNAIGAARDKVDPADRIDVIWSYGREYGERMLMFRL